MKKTVRYLGMEDGRVAYKVTIRKNHLVEDYTEFVRIQESSPAKRRFYICFEGFNATESENFMRFAFINNESRNNYVRKDCQVTYSAMTFISA